MDTDKGEKMVRVFYLPFPGMWQVSCSHCGYEAMTRTQEEANNLKTAHIVEAGHAGMATSNG